MDKFDLQIAMLKPAPHPAKLDERQFMKKLTQARRTSQTRHLLMALMALAVVAITVGALRRNILDVVVLTFRYLGDLPSMFKEYSHAYLTTISWPGIASIAFLGVLAAILVRSRKDVTAARSKHTYQYALAVAVLALGLGVTGLLGSSTAAHAQQENIRRTLNERGHLEVQVGGKDFELYGKSQASDSSIRNQAIIESIRNFDISKAYPELHNMFRDGFVAEIRAINDKDDCIFYTERRLEPVLNKVVDANAGCIHGSDQAHTYYLNQDLQPVKAPKWKVGQTGYFTGAYVKDTSNPMNPSGNYAAIVVLLDGKADDYVAPSNSEKIVPKGQPGTGVQSCGIDRQDDCPNVGYIDVFTNEQGKMASGEIGSSVPGDSLQPKSGSQPIRLFGKILAVSDSKLEVETSKGKKVIVAWPKNVIEEFNTRGATSYEMIDGTLRVQPGDYLVIDAYYRAGMSLETLSISDVRFIGVALKASQPDALTNEPYSKEKAVQMQKYQP